MNVAVATIAAMERNDAVFMVMDCSEETEERTENCGLARSNVTISAGLKRDGFVSD